MDEHYEQMWERLREEEEAREEYERWLASNKEDIWNS